MAGSRTKLVPLQDLAGAPHLELTKYARSLWIAAGRPGRETMANWTTELADSDAEEVSGPTAMLLINGTYGDRHPVTIGWDKARMVGRALWHHRREDADDWSAVESRLRKCWDRAFGPPIDPAPGVARFRSSWRSEAPRNLAHHFGRLTFNGARDISRRLEPNRGCVALCVDQPDPAAAREVFSVDFQSRVFGLLNQKQLRFDGHSVHLQHIWMHSSWVGWTWMPAPEVLLSLPGISPRSTRRDREVRSRCFIAIEASMHGAVAVYFERPGTSWWYEHETASTELGRLLNYWVRGAWEMALSVAHMLGYAGTADGVTLVAPSAVEPHLKEPSDDDHWPSNATLYRYPDDSIVVYHDKVRLIPATVHEEFALDGAESRAGRPMQDVRAFFEDPAYCGDLGFAFT